ncbi:hypothetical protein CR203_12245 [Salipaludibacillus neizhouensis]|uniref:DUF443 domain-containing protein n=1 Tax=Salipaludibacillus neizhouensis TaxID=885475 RepID=A0A3A9KA08_9BACI|nr:DUF443 family protein [Salipaludibacillus neizhouensis]RKL67271.1 hypothetical protein CR203_12245 [Salipaludibacillus neizhouensis]
MKCEVRPVYKNPRYRILKIKGKTYVLDMSQSIWKIVFPFLTWIVPNTIYQVDEEEIGNKFKAFSKGQKRSNISILLTAGLGISIANLLRPLTEYFEMESTLLFNVALSGIVIILGFCLRSYLSHRNQQKLYNVITLDKTSQERIWITPKSFKHFIQVFFCYVLFQGGSVLFFLVFIQDGNLVPFFVATFLFPLMLLVNVMTVLDGSTKVKFKKGK